MKFKVEWSCDDEFCTEHHDPTEIEAGSEQEAIKIVEKVRANREMLGISVVPCRIKYEKILWEKLVYKS